MNRKSAQHRVRISPSVDHFFLATFPVPWVVFLDWYGFPRDAYIECWSRGEDCIPENACGADGPLGKNAPGLEPDGLV